MHNIKNIRNNIEEFKKKIKSRNLNINFDEILLLDKSNRNLIQQKENEHSITKGEINGGACRTAKFLDLGICFRRA